MIVDEITQINGTDEAEEWAAYGTVDGDFPFGVVGYGATAEVALADLMSYEEPPADTPEIGPPTMPEYTFAALPVSGLLGGDHDFLM